MRTDEERARDLARRAIARDLYLSEAQRRRARRGARRRQGYLVIIGVALVACGLAAPLGLLTCVPIGFLALCAMALLD